jgi:hypothetical protein
MNADHFIPVPSPLRCRIGIRFFDTRAVVDDRINHIIKHHGIGLECDNFLGRRR